jgi:arsenite methyltransferase
MNTENNSSSNNNNNNTNQDIKSSVQQIYTQIASQSKTQNSQSLCGVGGSSDSCCAFDYTIFSEDYTTLGGYCKTADLGLGCGIPTSCITIKKGDYVVDLGCGAGNDCFVARDFAGEAGKVIGIDFTPVMLKKAWENLDNTSFNNVEFRFGDVEDMPIKSGIIDVVISNCVINLIENKQKVFKEINRILKPQGFFSISDVVLGAELPEKLKKCVELYAGCVSGAVLKKDYLNTIENAGFKAEVRKEKEIVIPDEVLKKYLNEDEIEDFKGKCKILSITVIGVKQQNKEEVEQIKTSGNENNNSNKGGCCQAKKCC